MSRPSFDPMAVRLARLGAALGVAAGLVELTVGPEIRDWVGEKQDTTRLGIVTIVLSSVALASVTVRRRPVERHRLAVVLGLLLPGLICFSTVGRLWLVPGPLLLISSALLLAAAAPGELRAAVDGRRRQAGLVVVCGALYVALGATALGVAGLLGVLGGLLVWVSMAVAHRAPRTAAVLLCAGAIPFAAATWWSVVTPLLALLMLGLGRIAIRRAGDRPPADAPKRLVQPRLEAV